VRLRAPDYSSVDDVYGRYAEALRAGHQFAASGQLKEALKCYRTATEVAPDRPVPFVALGGALLRLGQNKDALASYERALELAPNDVDALTGRAAALLAAGKRDEAKQVQQQLYGSPVSAGGHGAPMSAADRHLASGEQARADGRNSAAIDEWLAESAEHRVCGHHDASLDACLRALSLDSSAPRVHLEIARAWMARGWHDRAQERLRLLDRLLALQPDKHVAAAARELTRK
jgi:tetratricopeptide (TPR) repeat protein